MSLQKTNVRNYVLVGAVIAAIAMRLVNTQVPALSNFTPVGAVALFGGAYFTDKWKAYLVPLITLVISDLLINYIYTSTFFAFYASSLWMYGCFMLMVYIGSLIRKVNIGSVAMASLAAVLIHWLVMDLPVVYGIPFTWAGYGALLVKAIPFELNMLIADAAYGAILFGGFELAKSKYTLLQPKKQLSL
ncbi:hypothetical protein FPZ43_01960 [Mucilaginibacter pallidiroseus]|uniref:Uncharacterized protein n=1 Tax=Mucilaginibacter pallidiroseus TaxID=2599295 RepID=A0A563UIS6_9SPHI|nr:DUF6580 family putative transport protein [Mucilaginibacter pallidiroseus]TWR31265.1 hypothetical protein FPZ43_01960 [Mucilaginibacter pallidiroseus]